MRNIGIVGPREKYLDSPDGAYLKRQCRKLVEWLMADSIDTRIVSGGADGIDTLAENCAREHVEAPDPLIILPETDPKTGRWVNFGAALARNSKIVATATEGVYALWNGTSTGTLDTIKKAWKQDRLNEVIFPNGVSWIPSSQWNPIEYGAFMAEKMFDNTRLAQALQVRLLRNRRNKNLMDPDGKPYKEKLAYADGRAIDGFTWLVEGNKPTPGEGELEGYWIAESRNKKKEGVRSHQIDFSGQCNCDAVTKGHHACYAMMAVNMFLWLIDPKHMNEDLDIEVLQAA